MTKYKFKKFIKEKKGFVIGIGSFLLVGLIALFIGLGMSGWSLVKWLQSPYATTFFIMLACGLVLGAIIVIFLFLLKDDIKGK